MGTYRIVAANDHGITESNCEVEVRPPVRFFLIYTKLEDTLLKYYYNNFLYSLHDLHCHMKDLKLQGLHLHQEDTKVCPLPPQNGGRRRPQNFKVVEGVVAPTYQFHESWQKNLQQCRHYRVSDLMIGHYPPWSRFRSFRIRNFP